MTAAPAALHDRALHLLQTIWGYPAFRGVQGEIVQQVAEGGNALVLMPTGGGKSLCYQLPSLLRPGTGIVVSPLIALMKDQVDTLRQNGVRAAFLNSTLLPHEAREVEDALLRGDLDLLYVAPERLLMPRTLDLLERAPVALFAIDEAHCVSQWGHDFRPEYQQLSVLAERFPELPRVALTATADERTRADIKSVLRLEDAPQFVSSFDRPNIQYRVGLKDSPKTQLLHFIREEHPGDAGIVYCLSRKSVEETAKWLQAQGIDALAYHAGLSSTERNNVQERFLNEEGVIVCATVAFGMGIDKPNVRFVAHLDLPKSMEGYYQETGRAGRDGLPSTAWMVYGLSDVVNVRRMLAQSDAPEEVKRVEASKLDALLTYCEAATCRRQVLLHYFGEELSEPCGNCDVCLNPPRVRDLTREAQMALSATIRTGNRFGAAHLTDVLLGRETDKVLAQGHHQLPTFGVGKEHDEKLWRSVLRQLVSLGYLSADDHFGLRATGKSRGILKEGQKLLLREDTLLPGAGKSKRDRASASRAALDSHDAPLFEALRAWRLQKAKELSLPPYTIFHDATLKTIAELRPGSHATLGTVSGVGGRKLAAYGDEVLQVVRDSSGGGQAGPENLLDSPAFDPAVRGARNNNAVLDVLGSKGELQPQPKPAHPGVLGALRELRRTLAAEQGRSLSWVFPEATIDELARKLPTRSEELKDVFGLGGQRIQAFGDRILATIRAELTGGAPSPAPSAPAALFDEAVPPAPNADLSEALRELRRELMKETGYSAFVVFTNATLEALAARQPRTLAELAEVPGLGEKRIEAYGERILDAINTVLDG
ncbi:DNA helicase RecQ [Deinococcus radiodurans]|jgi:ATP-dependent DNA helicase RecQ (EC 3.6.1.-)|uniref:DNA helicase RecQ n=2 Tax=Deinococcus radiodurans (strain ATCC 13939 / DSM 20539 / JCM 16871 / CCUG 27074 / LMG 4051 / NBRC 15346 / NCIMB 9279 / VKM B-1422 / R1) TaxID=243230 RepID=Q9RUU2_DEIRA|nr:DNA helicase RecQ [Deinococcus radiodurans]AAF10859.1 DNA helicase RecQ [Deinococcus radiodurans R1 = ATCC 13939 = DSM 20539]ANC71553.1 ATP-dependent DNA helicase RecQ [Deinococcus radiodurans R1 = ATCC 13939 = DSM 20539]QEM70758.1 DNA helicase RecQ [Deinococcus radiodurans]QIP29336.1 DNA helicase RecQ [Deinococcus radiodurans]QIP31967.1 DNA helicase RecQ [Deinococcus radiodurans]